MSTNFENTIGAPKGEFTSIKIGTYDVFSVDVENWNNTYTDVGHNMGNWNSTYTTLKSTSGDWQAIKMTVDTSKGDWDATATHVSHNMANWNSTYGSVLTTSANWDNVYSHVNSTSANWDHGSAGYATPSDISTAISNLVDSAPTTLDTLNELAAALGDDANFSTTVTNSIGTKWTQDDTKISNWDSTHTSVNTNSGNWQDTYTHVRSVSDTWGGAAGYTTDIGNNSDTTIEVTHNLNTSYITYSLIDNNTNEFVNTQTSIVDANKIQFVFTTAPTTNEYKVVIISTDGTATGGGGGSGGTSYTDSDVASYLNGNLDTHIIPDTNAAYDLGNAEYKIRHLFLSDNSIYMGNDNTPIRLNSDKKLVVDDVEVGGIFNYNTDDLPSSAANGTIALDKTINSPVYFLNGRWLKMKDDAVVADKVVEVYLMSGQSNAGGTASADNLSSYTQKDGEGTLAETRDHILITTNHPDEQSGVGGTLYPSGTHGTEVSFLDGIDNLRDNKQFLVKYYSGGSAIDTWDKTQSVADVGSGNRNNWDKLVTSIDNAIAWASSAGYILDWKGFIWWQGESDRSPSNVNAKAEYKQALQTLITNVRAHVSKPELPVCVIEVDNRTADDANGTNSASTDGMSEIQDAQAEVAEADDYVEFIDVTKYRHLMEYTDQNNDGTFDGVHWQTEAYVNIGWDVAERMNDIIEGTLAYAPPSPILWLDASDTSTVTYDSAGTQGVSEWRDKSDSNYHATQTTGSRQPKYNILQINGLPTVRCDSGDAIWNEEVVPANWQDVYIVSRYDDEYINNGVNQFYEYVGLFTGTTNSGANIGLQGTRDSQNLTSGWWDNLYLNGTVDTRMGILPDLRSEFLISFSADQPIAANGYNVGSDRSPGITPARNWKGPVGEIIAFNRKLTDAERQEIEGYLAHKWGLTAKLPNDHPYKTTAP